MNNEQVISVDTVESEESGCIGVRVLVVDCNSTCLAIASRMLRAFGYIVMTASGAIDAMHILQEREDELDLILTEVHLPDMDKYQLLEGIGEMSCLPIVVLSADYDENTVLGCLFKGAEFYLSKPITMNDVKNLWQFSCMKKQEAKVCPEESTSFEGGSPPENSSNEVSECNSFSDVSEQRLPMGKRKQLEDMEEDDASSTQPKKHKLIWTNELHDKFLQAIKLLGIDYAHPKKILNHMNVPGLKKENISSHLQKYRLSLKREQDAIRRTKLGDYNISPCTLIGGILKYQMPQFLMKSKAEFRSHDSNQKNLNGSSISMDVDSKQNDISVNKFAELSPENYDSCSTYIKNCSNEIFEPVRNDNVEKSSAFCDVGNCEFLGNSSEQQQQFLLPPLSPPPPWEQQEDYIFEAEMGDTDELFDITPTGSTDMLQDEYVYKDLFRI